MTPLEQVNKIMSELQSDRWMNHSGHLLISSQGKLSALQSNISSLASEARHAMDMTEIAVKQKEADLFLSYRRDHGMTIQEAQANARIDCFGDWGKHFDAKQTYNDLKGIVDAMKNLITACQVTIRSLREERNFSNYVENQ